MNDATAPGLAVSDITVAYRNGAPVRVSDVGRVLDSVENDKTAAWRGNPKSIERAVVLGIRKQPGANTVEVAKGVLALLPKFREEIPPAIEVVQEGPEVDFWIDEVGFEGGF